jgi:hypothetical protein
MRILLLALLLASGLVLVLPGSAQDKAADSIQGKPENHYTNAKLLPSTIVQPYTSPEAKNPRSSVASEDVEKSVRIRTPVTINSVKDRWDRALVVLTALLVGVGIFQIIFVWRAVGATRDSVRAVINSERAWIIAELVPEAYRDERRGWHHKDGKGFTYAEALEGKHFMYSLRVLNTGRTPAQMLRYCLSYSCVEEGVTGFPEIGAEDTTEEGEFTAFVVNNDAVEITPLRIDSYMKSKDDWELIGDLKKTAVFHGWVTYRSVLSKDELRSEFRYVYSPELNALVSRGKYNKYT